MTTSPLFPGFDGLMTLSRREGVDIRPTLLRVLTDLYVQASVHSSEEERQFVELASRLIGQVDDATRAAVRARLAIYPGTPVEVQRRLGLQPARSDQPIPLAEEIPAAPAATTPAKPPSEVQLRMASNLAMQPQDAAEINDMFFRATGSERGSILDSLQDTPLRASARIPAARAARAIETLEMAAFAADVENFTRELGEALILPTRVVSQVVNDPGGEPLACAARALNMPSAVFQRVLLFLRPEFGSIGAQRVPVVAAVRPTKRTLRPDHAGRLARRDPGGDPRQISPIALRRRAPPRTRGARPNPSSGSARRDRNRLPAQGVAGIGTLVRSKSENGNGLSGKIMLDQGIAWELSTCLNPDATRWPGPGNAAPLCPQSRRSRRPGRIGFPGRDALPPRLQARAAATSA